MSLNPSSAPNRNYIYQVRTGSRISVFSMEVHRAPPHLSSLDLLEPRTTSTSEGCGVGRLPCDTSESSESRIRLLGSPLGWNTQRFYPVYHLSTPTYHDHLIRAHWALAGMTTEWNSINSTRNILPRPLYDNIIITGQSARFSDDVLFGAVPPHPCSQQESPKRRDDQHITTSRKP